MVENGYFASSCLSVCLQSVRKEQLGNGVSWNLIVSVFGKSVEKIQVSLNSDKNNRYFTWILIHNFNDMSLSSS